MNVLGPDMCGDGEPDELRAAKTGWSRSEVPAIATAGFWWRAVPTARTGGPRCQRPGPEWRSARVLEARGASQEQRPGADGARCQPAQPPGARGFGASLRRPPGAHAARWQPVQRPGAVSLAVPRCWKREVPAKDNGRVLMEPGASQGQRPGARGGGGSHGHRRVRMASVAAERTGHRECPRHGSRVMTTQLPN